CSRWRNWPGRGHSQGSRGIVPGAFEFREVALLVPKTDSVILVQSRAAICSRINLQGKGLCARFHRILPYRSHWNAGAGANIEWDRRKVNVAVQFDAAADPLVRPVVPPGSRGKVNFPVCRGCFKDRRNEQMISQKVLVGDRK